MTDYARRIKKGAINSRGSSLTFGNELGRRTQLLFVQQPGCRDLI